MSSDAAAVPGVGLSWKKYLFMAIGIVLFIIVYYSPPWPNAIDRLGGRTRLLDVIVRPVGRTAHAPPFSGEPNCGLGFQLAPH